MKKLAEGGGGRGVGVSALSFSQQSLKLRGML